MLIDSYETPAAQSLLRLGRERRQRLDYSLALTGAYDEVRATNAELHEKARQLAARRSPRIGNASVRC
ncbi:MAG: hypothetical protein ACLPY3_07115 [Solirubrobacteraceae bacterium]